eukprot:s118_g47.t1
MALFLRLQRRFAQKSQNASVPCVGLCKLSALKVALKSPPPSKEVCPEEPKCVGALRRIVQVVSFESGTEIYAMWCKYLWPESKELLRQLLFDIFGFRSFDALVTFPPGHDTWPRPTVMAISSADALAAHKAIHEGKDEVKLESLGVQLAVGLKALRELFICFSGFKPVLSYAKAARKEGKESGSIWHHLTGAGASDPEGSDSTGRATATSADSSGMQTEKQQNKQPEPCPEHAEKEEQEEVQPLASAKQSQPTAKEKIKVIKLKLTGVAICGIRSQAEAAIKEACNLLEISYKESDIAAVCAELVGNTFRTSEPRSLPWFEPSLKLKSTARRAWCSVMW